MSPSSLSTSGSASADSSRLNGASTGLGSPVSPGTWQAMLPPEGERPKALSWLDPRVLWRSRNELVARIHDPVPHVRARWMSSFDEADPLTVRLPCSDFVFCLLGDTGEGDSSQYALIPTLNRVGRDAAFVFICGDLIYPAGDVHDYGPKFYRPYRNVPRPVYALPGNHDWYDGLDGFMEHLCDTCPMPPDFVEDTAGSLVTRLTTRLRRSIATALWRGSATPDVAVIERMKQDRAAWPQPVPQPGPYFVLETEHVRFVCIDPGILGNLDAQQGRWLVAVSSGSDKPKVLLTGKPLVVDGEISDCPIDGSTYPYRSVLDVVHDEALGYVAVIGGDVHNYQRYPVRLHGDAGHPDLCRTIHHVVSGGGGAFMHATHTIPRISAARVLGVTEEEFRCYPLRRDSMAVYSRVIDTRFRESLVGRCLDAIGRRPDLNVTSEEAGLFLRDTYDIQSLGNRPIVPVGAATTADELPAGVRRRCRWLMRLGGGAIFHRVFSPFLDWDDPPFSKNFLRIEVTKEALTVQCYSVTGALEQEDLDTVEDAFTIALDQQRVGGRTSVSGDA